MCILSVLRASFTVSGYLWNWVAFRRSVLLGHFFTQQELRTSSILKRWRIGQQNWRYNQVELVVLMLIVGKSLCYAQVDSKSDSSPVTPEVSLQDHVIVTICYNCLNKQKVA